MKLAEAIKAKRIVDYQNGKFGFHQPEHNIRFFDYYSAMCEKRKGSPESWGNWGNWYSSYKHLKIYEKNENITFDEITPEWVQGFKDYLENDAKAWSPRYERELEYHPLFRNSKLSYFNKLRACIHQALADGVISDNPLRGVKNFKAEESKRMCLTIDEIKAITAADCPAPGVKRAFLFSCLTGLRRSDIMKMTWSEVHKQGDYTRIIFKQKKTSGQEYIDITPQAAELLGERKNPTDLVFNDFLTASATNNAIKVWMLRAGITKEITFHCARHNLNGYLPFLIALSLVIPHLWHIFCINYCVSHVKKLRISLFYEIKVVTLQPKYNKICNMGKLADSLKRHFEETPQDVLDREWEELKHLNDIGPDATEYVERVRSYYATIIQDSRKSTPVMRYPRELFQTDCEYYLAA